jgi:hypothetical protein
MIGATTPKLLPASAASLCASAPLREPKTPPNPRLIRQTVLMTAYRRGLRCQRLLTRL